MTLAKPTCLPPSLPPWPIVQNHMHIASSHDGEGSEGEGEERTYIKSPNENSMEHLVHACCCLMLPLLLYYYTCWYV